MFLIRGSTLRGFLRRQSSGVLRTIPSAGRIRWSGIAGQKSPIVEAAAKTQQGFESM